jgi:hypothetical protein
VKKTVGIATFTGQWPLNYGSALQTTALQWMIRDMGYRPISSTINLGSSGSGFLYSLRKFSERGSNQYGRWISTFIRFVKFFRKNNVRLSVHLSEFASVNEAIKYASKHYDILCVGSDAIWLDKWIRPFFLMGL